MKYFIKSLCFFLIILIIPLKEGLCSTDVHYLDSVKSSRNVTVSDDLIVFCTRATRKSPEKIWSTAQIEFKSNDSSCKIHENYNLSNPNSIRESENLINSYLLNLAWFKSLDKENCNQVVNVPLYQNFCVALEMNGNLQVNYSTKVIDYRLVVLSGLGLLLYYWSKVLSKNEIFHFLSGVSLGVSCSLLVLLFIIYRVIPQKKIGLLAILTSSSFFVFLVKWLYKDLQNLMISFKLYIFGYIAVAVLFSAIYFYLRGPISNPRAINLIELLLKLISFILLYSSISYKELSISLVIGFALANLALKSKFNFTLVSKIKEKYFPTPRKLLSQDEYTREGIDYTQKALKELKDFCQSPECNSWKIVSRLKNPEKFARFIQDNDDTHLDEEEFIEYEKYSISNDLLDEDNEL